MGSKSQCNISSLIMDNKDFLNLLARSKSDSKRHRMLKQANSQQLLAIAEICLNIVKARYQLTTRQRKRLLPYAEFVRRMSRARSERGARKIISQKGSGFGGVLTALLTPILIEIGRKIIKSDTDTN